MYGLCTQNVRTITVQNEPVRTTFRTTLNHFEPVITGYFIKDSYGFLGIVIFFAKKGTWKE
jgi:hypothetical protein